MIPNSWCLLWVRQSGKTWRRRENFSIEKSQSEEREKLCLRREHQEQRRRFLS
jgi:hypothetical protein